MSLRFGGIEFEHVSYDQEGDVLYLRNGPSTAAVDWDEFPEVTIFATEQTASWSESPS